MSSSIENIEKVLGAKRFGDRSAQIDWILTDSRSLCFPEETLFFALKTKSSSAGTPEELLKALKTEIIPTPDRHNFRFRERRRPLHIPCRLRSGQS